MPAWTQTHLAWVKTVHVAHAAQEATLPAVGVALRKRQAPVSADVTAIAWKAQHRLHARYRHLTARGKCRQETVTAVGRELLGFIWAIGVHVDADGRKGQSPAA